MRHATIGLLVLMACAIASASIPVQDPPKADPIDEAIALIDIQVKKYKDLKAEVLDEADAATEDGDYQAARVGYVLAVAYTKVIKDLEGLENALKDLKRNGARE